jgi:predicted O-methyltransferase YrrM
MNISQLPVISRIAQTGGVEDAAGTILPLHSGIDPKYAQVLHDLVLREKPELVVEIGMAYGISTMAVLSALEANGSGRLISIDPSQTSFWKGIGMLNVQRSGWAARHQLIEKSDHIALPELLAQGTKVQLAYIDGTHTFDHVFLDLFYLDKMLERGRLVGFNDCIYPAIHKVLQFLRTHRRYQEIDVGLPREFTGKVPVLSSIVRRLQDRIPADRYYRKQEEFNPAWDFYAKF